MVTEVVELPAALVPVMLLRRFCSRVPTVRDINDIVTKLTRSFSIKNETVAKKRDKVLQSQERVLGIRNNKP